MTSSTSFSYVTNAGSEYALGMMFGRTKTALSDYYVALCTNVPEIGDDGSTIKEPSASLGYVRARVPNDADHWVLSGHNEIFNLQELTWQVGEVSWGNLTAFGVLDTEMPGTGQLFFCGRINPGITPAPLTKIVVSARQLALTATSISSSFQPV